MKSNKTLVITVIICLLPMILGVVFYDKLPEQMPIHFTINDVPDNYGPKDFALFALPTLMAILQLVCCLISRIRLKKEEDLQEEPMPKAMKIIEWIIPIMSVVVYTLMVTYALGVYTCIGKIVCLMMGIIFMLMGNYLPKMKYAVGKHISHPVIEDEEQYRKSTIITGYAFFILGIVFLVLMFFV